MADYASWDFWTFILNFNSIPFKQYLEQFAEKISQSENFSNPNDPILLYLNFNIPKNYMNTCAKYITMYLLLTLRFFFLFLYWNAQTDNVIC